MNAKAQKYSNISTAVELVVSKHVRLKCGFGDFIIGNINPQNAFLQGILCPFEYWLLYPLSWAVHQYNWLLLNLTFPSSLFGSCGLCSGSCISSKYNDMKHVQFFRAFDALMPKQLSLKRRAGSKVQIEILTCRPGANRPPTDSQNGCHYTHKPLRQLSDPTSGGRSGGSRGQWSTLSGVNRPASWMRNLLEQSWSLSTSQRRAPMVLPATEKVKKKILWPWKSHNCTGPPPRG